jgi:hypothetical protein
MRLLPGLKYIFLYQKGPLWIWPRQQIRITLLCHQYRYLRSVDNRTTGVQLCMVIYPTPYIPTSTRMCSTQNSSPPIYRLLNVNKFVLTLFRITSQSSSIEGQLDWAKYSSEQCRIRYNFCRLCKNRISNFSHISHNTRMYDETIVKN